MSNVQARVTIRWPVVAAISLPALTAGVAIGFGGKWVAAGVFVAAAPFALLPILTFERKKVRGGYLSLEIPVFLICFSELVWRARDAQALETNPLDAAGLFRLACVSLAAALAVITLFSPRTLDRSAESEGLLGSIPFRLYVLYVIVVFIGAPLSILPLVTAYRGFELAAGVLVVAAACYAFGREAIPRVERVLYWFIVGLLGVIWLEVIALPGQALLHTPGPIPLQILGVLPSVASNNVGIYGVLLALWSLARLLNPSERDLSPKLLIALSGFGMITLIAAQYRTGYAIFLAGSAILLVLRGRKMLAAVIVSGVAVTTLWGPTLLTQAEPYLLRGESLGQAQQLSGRTNWWELAVPVWRESPWLGKGLLTGTRFEVLAANGYGETSTIHGAWLEALVGTGVIGFGLLLTALLLSWRRAAANASRPNGRIVPLLLLTVLTLRCVTGSSFELSGYMSLLFLIVAVAPAVRSGLPSRAGPLGR